MVLRQSVRKNGSKAYRALLYLYPAEFRHEYGLEMERLFAMRREREPHLLLWLEALADLALTAPREHLHILAADLRHSARAWASSPGFVLTALLTIVLGICATTTVFSVIHAVLLRSLPYGDADRLVYVWTPAPAIADLPREIQPFYSDIAAWRRLSHTLENITAMKRYEAQLTNGNGGGLQRVGAAKVLSNFFETLEAMPQLGRTIGPIDERDPRVAVIGDGLWRTRFGADPNAIGRTIHVDRQPYRVIGVMPREFTYPHGNDFPGQYQFASLPRTDLWIPAVLTSKQQADPSFDDFDAVVARLGSFKYAANTLAQAQAELSAIESRLAPLHPPGWTSQQVLLVPFLETAVGPVRPLMRLLGGAVALVLLMACVNFASLLVARAANRAHEMGVRSALGAERSRLIRHLLTESVMLSAAGGLLAIPLSYVVLKAVVRLNPGDIPRFEETGLNTPVLVFGALLSLATGFASGAIPALSASRIGVGDLLRLGGRGATGGSPLWVRNTLIVSEIALGVVLLAGAGLMIRSYLAVQSEFKGFSPSTLTMSVVLDQQLENSNRIRREVLNRIKAVPGVQVAGSIDDLPLSTLEDKGFLEIEGNAAMPRQLAAVRETGGEYFRAMQIRLLEGRYLDDGDIPAKPEMLGHTAVISESLAKRHFRGRSAIGHRIRINDFPWSTIVGVVGDVRHVSLEEQPQPIVYYQNGLADSVAVRTLAAPEAIVPAIRKAVATVNSGVTVEDIRTMNQYVDQAAARRRLSTISLTVFAGVATILALVGFYGLLSYTVAQRTAEVGVRMALGASRRAVVAMVVGHGLKLTAAGIGLGLVLALLLTRVMASFLYGVRPVDPATFAAVPALAVAVALLASLSPAWKAARVDPIAALRQQ